MFTPETLTAASGRIVLTDGLQSEEEDSALAIADYYVDGKQAGYIMRSPSAQKFWVSTVGRKNTQIHYKSFSEAEAALLAEL